MDDVIQSLLQESDGISIIESLSNCFKAISDNGQNLLIQVVTLTASKFVIYISLEHETTDNGYPALTVLKVFTPISRKAVSRKFTVALIKLGVFHGNIASLSGLPQSTMFIVSTFLDPKSRAAVSKTCKSLLNFQKDHERPVQSAQGDSNFADKSIIS